MHIPEETKAVYDTLTSFDESFKDQNLRKAGVLSRSSMGTVTLHQMNKIFQEQEDKVDEMCNLYRRLLSDYKNLVSRYNDLICSAAKTEIKTEIDSPQETSMCHIPQETSLCNIPMINDFIEGSELMEPLTPLLSSDEGSVADSDSSDEEDS